MRRKRSIKLLCLTLAACMTAAAFAGCGAGSGVTTATTTTTTANAAGGAGSGGDAAEPTTTATSTEATTSTVPSAANVGAVGQGDADAERQGDRPSDMAANQTLRIGFSSIAAGIFNPAITTNNNEAKVTSLVFDALFQLTPDYNFIPRLVREWDVSDDNKTFTLHLAEGVKWHDGEDFDADDVLFTFKFIADPAYPGSQFSSMSAILGAQAYKDGETDVLEGVKVIDPHTVEITTAEVFAPFFTYMAEFYIIPEHIWGQIDISTAMEQSDLLQNPVGTGPFKLENFVVDQYITMVRNDDYFQGAPLLESVQILMVNRETSQGQLLNGEIDMVEVTDFSDEHISPYTAAGVPIEVSYWTSYRELGCNLRGNVLLQNPDVRRALMYALDRQTCCDVIWNGYASPANTVYAPFFWAYPGAETLEPYAYDPEKAIGILTDSVGWERRDGVMYADGQPVSFTCVTSDVTGSTEVGRAMLVFQQNFKDIGVDLQLKLVDFNELVPMVRGSEGWDFYTLGMGTGKDADGTGVFGSGAIGGGNNFWGYSNPRVDELLAEGLQHVDLAERQEIYFEIAQIINQEVPSLFICNWASGFALNPKLRNYTPSSNYSYANILNWYFAE